MAGLDFIAMPVPEMFPRPLTVQYWILIYPDHVPSVPLKLCPFPCTIQGLDADPIKSTVEPPVRVTSLVRFNVLPAPQLMLEDATEQPELGGAAARLSKTLWDDPL